MVTVNVPWMFKNSVNSLFDEVYKYFKCVNYICYSRIIKSVLKFCLLDLFIFEKVVLNSPPWLWVMHFSLYFHYFFSLCFALYFITCPAYNFMDYCIFLSNFLYCFSLWMSHVLTAQCWLFSLSSVSLCCKGEFKPLNNIKYI